MDMPQGITEDLEVKMGYEKGDFVQFIVRLEKKSKLIRLPEWRRLLRRAIPSL